MSEVKNVMEFRYVVDCTTAEKEEELNTIFEDIKAMFEEVETEGGQFEICARTNISDEQLEQHVRTQEMVKDIVQKSPQQLRNMVDEFVLDEDDEATLVE